MKVNLTKKVLCAVLSLLMVITSLPLVVSAYDIYDTNNAADLKSAIDRYEIKMDGKIYTNMSVAYEAYCNALKLYDQYVYGYADGRSAEIDGKIEDVTSTLIRETNKMTEWVPGSNLEEVTPVQKTTDNSTAQLDGPADFNNNTAFFNNILYVPNPALDANTPTISNGTVSIYYPASVVFYDGGDAPRIPVMTKSSEILWSLYPSQESNWRLDSKEISLIDYWRGCYPIWNGDFNFGVYEYYRVLAGNPTYEGDTAATVAYNYRTGLRGIQNSSVSLPINSYIENAIQINYTFSNNEYTKTITPTWYVSAGGSANSSESKIDSGNGSIVPIYVINYNALLQAIERNSQKLNIGSNKTYGNGKLAVVIDAFDKAMAINLSDTNTYNYASNMAAAVTDAGNEIKDAVKALDDAQSTPDPSEYQALRDAIDNQRLKYEDHFLDDGSIDSSLQDEMFSNWDQFVDAYKNALRTMNKAAEDGYPNSDLEGITEKADTLNYFVLEAVRPRVDTTLLETVIDNAQYVSNNTGYFIGADKDKIDKAVNDAKEEVWQGHYPHARYLPEDNDENFTLVLNHVIAIADTIRDLKINPATKVSYTDGLSLNDLKKSAEEKLANENEYANSATLSAVLDNVNTYLAENNSYNKLSEPGTPNYARDLVTMYEELVISVFDAVNSLIPAFTIGIPNGQVINFGDSSSVDVNKEQSGKDYYFNFKYSNNRVFFRTNHQATGTDENPGFNLGTASMQYSITVNNTNRRNYNLLDSINFNVNTDETWDAYWTGTKNGWGTPNGENFPKETYPGSLIATGSNNSTFEIKNIKVRPGSGGNGDTGLSYGRASNGDWLSDLNQVYDDILSTTDSSTDGSGALGGVYSYNSNITYLGADYILKLPEATNTEPTVTTYNVSKNLGITVRFKTSNYNSNYGEFIKSTPYTQTATVVDITPLLDLINQANAAIADSTKYTQTSLESLIAAVSEADDEFAYWNMKVGTSEDGKGNNETTNTIMGVINSRYEKLKSAYDALQERADFENGYKDQSTNETISSYDNAIYNLRKLLTGADTSDDNKRFGWYFESDTVNDLLTQLTEGTITEGTNQFYGQKRFKYINSTNEERINIPSSEQAKINSEIADLLNIYNTAGNDKALLQTADISGYNAALDSVKNLNADAYNVNAIQKVVDSNPLPRQSITVLNEPIICYHMADVNQTTNNITSSKTDNWYEYFIKVVNKDSDSTDTYYLTDKDGNLTAANSEDGKLVCHYGDVVTVKSFNDKKAAFATDVIAKATNRQTTNKLVMTSTEYQFDVRGDTTVYVSSTTSTPDSQKVKITFYDSRVAKRIVAVDYAVKGQEYQMIDAPVPSFMFYTIKDYTIGKDGSTTVNKDGVYTFNADTEVTVNYDLIGNKETTYQIGLLGTDGSSVAGYPLVDKVYNDKITVSVENAAGFVDNDTNELIAVGDTYTFRACQDITLKAVTDLSTQNNSVTAIKVPVIDETNNSNGKKKLQLVGAYAFPDGSKPDQFGIILDTKNTHTESMTLSDVNGSGVYNLSCSNILSDNQFANSVLYGGSKPFTYVAYVIYKDASGKSQTIYSQVRSYDPNHV